jgi:hypothetical protein
MLYDMQLGFVDKIKIYFKTKNVAIKRVRPSILGFERSRWSFDVAHDQFDERRFGQI